MEKDQKLPHGEDSESSNIKSILARIERLEQQQKKIELLAEEIVSGQKRVTSLLAQLIFGSYH